MRATDRLEIIALNVRHGRHRPYALQDANLTLRCGEVTGIIGPNGAGKSTLLKAVCGIIPAASGRIVLGDTDLQTLRQRQRAEITGYVPQQDDPSGSALTVFDAVALGANEGARRRDVERAVLVVARRLDLGPLLFQRVGELSGGQYQRVLIGRALVRDTPFLLLDEPVNNLDLHYQVEIMHLLRILAAEDGKAIAVVLHDMNLAATFCDRIAVIADATISCQGRASDVITASLVRELFGNVAEVGSFGRAHPGVLPKRKESAHD